MSRKPFKRYIRELVTALRCPLFLQEYHFDIEYHKQIPEHPRAAATIDVDYTYLSATIRVADTARLAYRRGEYRTVCKYITHELCHIHTEPLYWLALQSVPKKFRAVETANYAARVLNGIEEVRERQTHRMTIVVMGFLPAKFYHPETVGEK